MNGLSHPRFDLSWGDHETVTNVQAGNTKLGKSDREFVRELYRGEIRYADANIGRIIDELKTLGLYEEALIVFASDHGEEFWEHGTFEHGHTLYDEVLRVPLSFKLPNAEDVKSIAHAVSTESILPTMLDVLGAPYEATNYSSESLRPMWEEDAEGQATFSTGTYYFDEKQAVVHEGWKLIRKMELDQYELFNLVEDPEELDSRYCKESDAKVREELKAMLRDWESRMAALREKLDLPDDVAVKADAHLESQLRAIGYGGD